VERSLARLYALAPTTPDHSNRQHNNNTTCCQEGSAPLLCWCGSFVVCMPGSCGARPASLLFLTYRVQKGAMRQHQGGCCGWGGVGWVKWVGSTHPTNPHPPHPPNGLNRAPHQSATCRRTWCKL
jgi:hypothetical protein